MKFIKYCLLSLFAISLYSCLPEEKDLAQGYYKSTFLGSDSFQLKGLIFDRDGNPVSGNKIIGKISEYGLDDWNVESTLNNNQFTININKTGDNGNLLPIIKNDDIYRYDTAWEIFTPYFSVPGNYDDDKRDKKMYLLNIFLDDFEYKNQLHEFIGNRPTKYFSYFVCYVYIPEPIEISGSYRFEDEFWRYYYSFDCDFSQPGWYKIYSDTNPIGNNQAITSTVNTRHYKN